MRFRPVPRGLQRNCLNDSNANGICDEQETLGCTDLEACNFDQRHVR